MIENVFIVLLAYNLIVLLAGITAFRLSGRNIAVMFVMQIIVMFMGTFFIGSFLLK